MNFLCVVIGVGGVLLLFCFFPFLSELDGGREQARRDERYEIMIKDFFCAPVSGDFLLDVFLL